MNEKVRLAVLDVGQGDTLVVSHPESGEAVVIDCISAPAVFDYFKSQEIRRVRALIITHLHSDHYRQARAFLTNCRRELGYVCEKVILNPIPETEESLPPPDEDGTVAGRAYEAFAQWMLENAEIVDSPHPSPRLPIDGPLAGQIDFVYPYPAELPYARAAGYNNSSLVLRVRGLRAAGLLPGDLEPTGWALLRRRPAARAAVRAQVMKWPHHGAWKPSASEASAAEFLKDVGAELVAISVGTRQRGYAHPDPDVFAALRAFGVKILCTQATQRCGVVTSATVSAAPCAGTVIVDLDDVPRLLQPDLEIHWRDVVQRCFAPSHQCLR